MRVVIAEDSVLLREGLTRLLAEAGHDVVAAAGEAEEFLRAVGKHEPDVVVVDVRMPPTFTDEGLRAALVVRQRWPGVGVLVLSQYVEERYATELLADRPARRRLPAQGPGRRTWPSSSTRWTGSPPAAARSTRRWSRSCWPAAGTRWPTSPPASARCSR